MDHHRCGQCKQKTDNNCAKCRERVTTWLKTKLFVRRFMKYKKEQEKWIGNRKIRSECYTCWYRKKLFTGSVDCSADKCIYEFHGYKMKEPQ